MARPWRVAKSLLRLREQIDAMAPGRKKGSDGTIGDAKHQSRTSDHNAWIQDGDYGVVSALDITHDVGAGVDTWQLAEYLRTKRDSRIKYVISNKRIFSATTSPWAWRKYTGSNPHSSHFHVSVLSTKSRYDSVTDWDIKKFGAGAPTPERPGPDIDPDSPSVRRVLRRGDKGDDVKAVQHLLGIVGDGMFGSMTESAVKGFQHGVGLKADGIVGPLTWAELDLLEQEPVDLNKQTNITATVFGGTADPNKSAYEDRWITDDEFGLALPYRFAGDRPQIDVINRSNGRSVICDIVDVGPWMTTDQYWAEKARPIAETCWRENSPLPSGPNKGKVPRNGAGIDLTPAAAAEIGLPGRGQVDWAFVGDDKDEGEGVA